MNTREAKEILLLYRGTIDDSDPQFRAALDYAKTDPELGQWLREQTKCYDTVRSKLRAIEPPLGLSEKIVRRRPIPFPRDWSRIGQLAAAILISASVTALLMKWSERPHRSVAGAQEILVTGEVLDMTCYIAYHLSGPDHAECARVCIRNGGPVGIKAQDGKVYLLTAQPGESVNAQLADYAAKTVTIRGKETARDGFAQLQVEEIRKS
ncbi:MAG TPA: hypothetical protein VNY07_07445 [Chthoniobacterales bacterium]|jgi:hypothetical protein|nr:hypothetical protein [Chthoniobacterales bacterium]